jgi:hypothetical protein
MFSTSSLTFDAHCLCCYHNVAGCAGMTVAYLLNFQLCVRVCGDALQRCALRTHSCSMVKTAATAVQCCPALLLMQGPALAASNTYRSSVYIR